MGLASSVRLWERIFGRKIWQFIVGRKMSIYLDLTKTERLRAVNAWLTYHGIGKTALAEKLGVDPSFITYVLQGKRRSRKIFKELVGLGIPKELLPPQGVGPGRPPKK